MGKWLFNSLFPGENITYRDKLVECVNKQMTGHQTAKELNVDYTCVHRWLRKLGLNLPNFHNELKFDNTVFDTIDTEEKAYWLGFMYADGYVSKNGKTVELTLKGDDADHLKKFADFLHHKEGIKFNKSKCNGKEFSRCRLVLTNQHFNQALARLGCVPNKSLILQFPNSSIFANSELIRHFVRGYIDGDGTITLGSTGYSGIYIIGTFEFLEGIKAWYPNAFSSASHKDKRHPDSNTFYIFSVGKKAAEFGSILYNNATIYLQRKYDKFIENKYDEREHFRRMHTFSEKKQLYFARATNGIWKNSLVSEVI